MMIAPRNVMEGVRDCSMMIAPRHVMACGLLVLVALTMVSVQTADEKALLPCSSIRHSHSHNESSAFLKNDGATATPAAQNQSSIQPDRPTFVLVMGLEGTGHHLLSQILRTSPAVQGIERLGILNNLKRLHGALYGAEGTMVAPCKRLHYSIRKSFMGAVKQMRNMTAIIDVANRNLQPQVTSSAGDSPQNPMFIPINAMGYGPMMSYPTAYACDRMQYPLLDHYYQVCREAGAQCAHMYLYRDATSILASTTVKRHFNPSTLTAMHMYTTYLHILYAQLARYSMTTLACLELYSTDDDSDSKDDLAKQLDVIAQLFGWKDDKQAFAEFMATIYQPPVPMTRSDSRKLVPPDQSMYLEHFDRANHDVLNLCRTQAERSFP